MNDSTENQVREASPWLARLTIVLFIFLLISVGAVYYLWTNYSEMSLEMERIEKESRMWELNFLNFYFFASRDWNEAERYATNILLKSFSDKFAEENDWTAREQYQWELTTGKDYVQKILK